MTLILVLLFWAALASAAVYRYRNVEEVADFLCGFRHLWITVIRAEAPDIDRAQSPEFNRGVITAAVSLCAILFVLAVLFIVSIIWAA